MFRIYETHCDPIRSECYRLPLALAEHRLDLLSDNLVRRTVQLSRLEGDLQSALREVCVVVVRIAALPARAAGSSGASATGSCTGTRHSAGSAATALFALSSTAAQLLIDSLADLLFGGSGSCADASFLFVLLSSENIFNLSSDRSRRLQCVGNIRQ
jgi:hypothetical protein